MQELAMKTLDYYRVNGLWIGEKQEDGSYNLSQQKLSDDKYQKAYQTIQGLNNDGYTPEEVE